MRERSSEWQKQKGKGKWEKRIMFYPRKKKKSKWAQIYSNKALINLLAAFVQFQIKPLLCFKERNSELFCSEGRDGADAIRTPCDKEAHFSQEESDIHIS